MTTTAYELFGLGPDATRAELDAAYAARRAAYDPARIAGMDEQMVQLAMRRRQELAMAYASLRPALAAPPRLDPATERKRDRQVILALVVLVFIALSVPLLRNVAVPNRSVMAEGADVAALTAKPAPDFQLESLDGTLVNLTDYRGQVVLINIWATWCPPCVREIPRLQRLFDRYQAQGFVLLGVNTTFQDERAEVAQFVRDQGITYPVLLDVDGEVGQAYGSRLIPSSYLIDQNGKIVHALVGEVSEAQLSEQIARLLQE